MSALKRIGTGIVTGTLTLLALVVIILLVVTIGSIVGGVGGALIATGYNIAFGTSFDLLTAALAGSIVAVLGGSSAAASSGE